MSINNYINFTIKVIDDLQLILFLRLVAQTQANVVCLPWCKWFNC